MAQKIIADTGLVSDLVDDSNDNFTELYADVATAEADIDALKSVTTEAKLYAYVSTAEATDLDEADEWYFFKSTFTNLFAKLFTVGASGVTYIGTTDRDFEVEWKFCGNAEETSEISVGIALNAAFDANGKMTAGTLCPGSCGGSQSANQGQVTAFVSPHSLCCLELTENDVVSLVVRSSTATNGVTPTNGCASIHKFQ